jgi:hypothetical protein
MPDRTACIEESTWVYLATPPARNELAEAMTEVCRAAGWGVYRPEGRAAGPRQRLDAMRHADAVIVDLSAEDSQTVADLAAARDAGRPILALQPAPRKARAEISELLDGYDRAVVLACADTHECLQLAGETLTAASWRVLVRDAMSPADG